MPHQIRPIVSGRKRTYGRYIDDVFGVWQHDEDSLHEFAEALNNCHHALTFVVDSSHTHVDYLDVPIHKATRFASLHRKSCDKLTPLPYHSTHPPHMFKGIFIGEVKRLIRNTSDCAIFDILLDDTINKFKDSLGYPAKMIMKWLTTTSYCNREVLLHPTNRFSGLQTTPPPALSVIYRRGLPRPLIKAKLVLDDYPFQPKVTFKPPRSLLRTLTSTTKSSHFTEMESI